MDRTEAIEKLESGKIKVIFSVDMFNEGVDIPSVDMVMFLRPTESPIVFLQQLGRGLRRSKGKEYLNVLDFIGNYEKAGRVRYLLTGKNKEEKQNYSPADKTDYPDDCFVDFDMKLIDLFAEIPCDEFLASRHHQKVELRLLGVAEKEVLADPRTQHLLHGGAGLDRVGSIVIDAIIAQPQTVEQVVAAQLLVEPVRVLGPAVIYGLVNKHGVTP